MTSPWRGFSDNDRKTGAAIRSGDEQPTGTVYEICGLTLVADVPLPELHVKQTGSPDCFFELREPRSQSVGDDNWIHHWYRPGGEPWRSCAKSGRTYLLRFHDFADFCISDSATRITCHPAAHASLETVRHLLLDQVIPLCLSLRGRECLHASAVATPHGACGFVGDTRTGKSTLAASLVDAGCTLVADDCLALREVNGRTMAIPSYAGLRLWPDIAHTLSVGVPERPAASDQHRKRRVAFGALEAPIPVPLKALYVLVPPLSPQPDTILLERVTPADGLIELVRHAFRLDVTDRSMLAQQFRYFGRLTLETPIFRLNYPREYSALPAVRAAIFQSIVPKNG